MDQPADYTAAWRDYRKRRFVFWVVFLSYMPGVMAFFLGVGLPLASMTGIKPDYFFFAIAGTWMLAFVVTNLRAVSFPCPRCGQHFFRTWWYSNPLARRCVHCGLPKWAMSE
jgi:hypothetical protein